MKKKTLGLVIAFISVFALTSCGGPEGFDKKYADIANEKWCDITSDGYCMTIDDNPDDYDMSIVYKGVDNLSPNDMDELERFSDELNAIDEKIGEINKELGFSEALLTKMTQANIGDGKQSESNDKYSVTWSFNLRRGLEVLYEIKK